MTGDRRDNGSANDVNYPKSVAAVTPFKPQTLAHIAFSHHAAAYIALQYNTSAHISFQHHTAALVAF